MKILQDKRSLNNSFRLLKKKKLFNNPIWIIEISNISTYQTKEFDTFSKALKAFNYLTGGK